jgi:CelD/BcsL family acetyltransferase involved in cellulose biosynthesis
VTCDLSIENRTHVQADFSETLFATRVWLELWLEYFGGVDSGWWRTPPRGGATIEIAYRVEPRRVGPFRLRVATAAANSHSPRFDVHGTTPPTVEDLAGMMRDLRVDAIIAHYVSSTAKLAHAIDHAGNALASYRDFCEAAPFIDCTGDWEQFLTDRGKTRRKTWHYYERRAEKAGCTFENLTDWTDIAADFDEILQVEASGWKGKGGTSISQDARQREFYAKLCEALARRGSLRVFLLRCEARILAFQICALYAGTLSCLKIGFLEDFAKESPGQVLQLHIVRWAFAQASIRLFDMLGPASETKLKWATGVEELFTYYVFRAGFRGAIARFRWQIGPQLKARLTGSGKQIAKPDHAPVTSDDDGAFQ